VERNLEIIGEALAQASQLFPGSLDTVSELKYVKAQRNRIAHGYFNVDAARLWKAIHEDLPLLRGKIVEIQKLRCS